MRRVFVASLLAFAMACGIQPAGVGDRIQQAIIWDAGQSVAPVLYPDNPSCADLGYPLELKIDNVNGPFGGLYSSSDGYIDLWASSPDGVLFGFNSNLGIDAVVMKGGDAANVYFYAPETTGDANLVSPDNSSGEPAAISHVSFCYDYEVKVWKTANTAFDRTYGWGIDKTSATTELLLTPGQSYLVDYAVTVGMTGFTDGNFRASGTITIKNPAPVVATVTGVTDAMGSLAATVNCPVAFPVELQRWQELSCTWEADLPDGAARTNVATVATSGPVNGNTATAAVDFSGAPVSSIDECVVASDDWLGTLGEVCVGVEPVTFSYSRTFGPYDASVCGTPFTVPNLASFVASDSGATGSDGHSVDVLVVCPPTGCTLTLGYWKTHSAYGPAPYDDTWALLANGANTAFFATGRSWYQLFWTAPQGNAYVILAHQYMAAVLNGLNGADGSAVGAQLVAARALLEVYTPASLPRTRRAEALALAWALDDYNNGLTGPGHCSE